MNPTELYKRVLDPQYAEGMHLLEKILDTCDIGDNARDKLREAFELLKEQQAYIPTGIWICGKCNRLTWSFKHDEWFQVANKCCEPMRCENCNAVIDTRTGRPVPQLCDPCRAKYYKEKERKQMAAAEKIDDWDGWVYCEGFGDSEGFFPDLGEMRDWFDDNLFEIEGDFPEYVYICDEIPFTSKLDICDIIENIACDSYEDVEEHIDGTKELEQAIKDFEKRNESVVSFQPNYKKAVKVPFTREELMKPFQGGRR